jgi:hypothetical protein
MTIAVLYNRSVILSGAPTTRIGNRLFDASTTLAIDSSTSSSSASCSSRSSMA